DPSDPWWRLWFEAAGVTETDLRRRPGSSMGSQGAEANRAIFGQGAALLTPELVANELAEGRLIRPFELAASDGNAYWLVYPESRRNVPKIRAFRDLVLNETRPSRWRPSR